MNAANTSIDTSAIVRGALAIFALIVICAIAAVAYYYLRGVDMAKQAETVSRSFVTSSPVVERDLGTIVKMKEISAGRMHGSANKWKVEYSAVGKKRDGAISVMVQDVNGNWNVPSAELVEAGGKPINLL
jgi:hypothetical protein